MTFIKSASLIIINSIKKEIQNQNFNVLMLKRIASSQSFASKIVFPGGTLDECDYSHKWQPIIDKHFSKSQLENIGCNSDLSIYDESRTLSSSLKPEIFYRICAIREAFEETGILLAQDSFNRPITLDDKLLQDIKVLDWQRKVSQRSDLFLDMCTSYGISPDLPALKEWSEWLTPAAYERRFNVVLFTSIIHEELATFVNRSEYEDSFWKTPTNALDDHLEKNEFAVPQAWELFSLSRLPSWKHVEVEAATRNLGKIKRSTGVVYNLSNGKVFVLPGDSRFRPGMELEEKEFSLPNTSLENFRDDKWKKRIVIQENRTILETNLNLDPCQK